MHDVAIDYRHNTLRDDWSRIARRAGLSTATEQFAAVLPPVSQNTARPHLCRDVRVMAVSTKTGSYDDVVVTSTPHWREGHWHVGGRGKAVARKRLAQTSMREGLLARYEGGPSGIFKVLRFAHPNHFFGWSLQVCPKTRQRCRLGESTCLRSRLAHH